MSRCSISIYLAVDSLREYLGMPENEHYRTTLADKSDYIAVIQQVKEIFLFDHGCILPQKNKPNYKI
jgi:hypothetical protein